MAKKPRSQRRKKGASMGGSTEDKTSKKGSTNIDKVEELSDTYTVADTFSIASTLEDDFSDDLLGEDGEHDDDHLHGGYNGTDNAAIAASLRQQRLVETLNQLDEFTGQKRAAKRESILRKVFRGVTHYATGSTGLEYVEHHCDNIQAACLFSLRQGSAAEQYAACRVLEATSVVLGSDQDEFYEDVLQKPLTRVIMTTKTRAVAVRIAALRALTMCNFICSSDNVATNELLDMCEQIAQIEYRNEITPISLRTAALDCWALLSTTLPDVCLAGQLNDCDEGRGLSLLKLLKECLDTNDVELRAAAGECMSLIHEARLNLTSDHYIEESSDDDDDNNDDADHPHYEIDSKSKKDKNKNRKKFQRQGSWEGSDWEVLMDEIRQRISELSVESGYHLSKKAKKQQKATFREFMATIVDDESPEEVVMFRNNGSITLQTWAEIIQLNFIRHCLQGGFQIQLLTNETLHDIFGADGQMLNVQTNNNMSALEKRLIMSKTSEASKLADMKMNKQRKKRNNIKNHFLTVDGDDI